MQKQDHFNIENTRGKTWYKDENNRNFILLLKNCFTAVGIEPVAPMA